MRKGPKEIFKWGGHGLIQDPTDSFKLHVYVNTTHTIVNGGLLGEDLSPGLGWDNSEEAHYSLHIAKGGSL